MSYIDRTLGCYIKSATQQFPVLLVTGPRQVGKTTLLKKLAEESRSYVTLDDPMVRTLANEEPALFLQRFRPPLLIDEIQYAPQLLPLIKMAVDRDRSSGQFWLTGSQQFHLMKNVSESLAGRVGVVNLLGLSQRETIGQAKASPFLPTEECLAVRRESPPLSLQELYERIWLGSFPALYRENPIDWNLFYSSYVQTYLERDVQELANVGDGRSFLRFLRACAARTGQMLNVQELCRVSGVHQQTANRWLSILEASRIVYLLEPFYSNINKRLAKTPKLYFLETGLAAWLTEWSSAATLEAGAMSGAMLESWVVSELLKSYWHNGLRAPFFYYRDHNLKEIDLLISLDGRLYPIEIKKSAHPTKEMLRHFKVLESLKQPIDRGGVISLAPTWLPINECVDAIPIGMV